LLNVWDDFDPDEYSDEDESHESERPELDPPTPGERLLHALGQLHRLHLCGRLPAHPSAFDVEDVARIVGVWSDLEFVASDEEGRRYHFADEVLCISADRPEMIRLLSVWQFAANQDLNELWREG
jgi:hypothetical protein